jgi:hypothetical protein
MDSDLHVLTLLLLDPCLTADEAAREAAARIHTAGVAAELRSAVTPRRRPSRRREPGDDQEPPMRF